ncbi:MAG: hypothetical protein H0V81_10110 [Solirubrobacterales bacterium]|nr:hypothetical protein [Solirubrobacterales bacterium]
MSSELNFARMPGSSIASPGAVGWVTDFLNASFYARPGGERSVGDLRLALGILNTAWERAGRRLGARDLRGFAVAYTGLRLRGSLRLDRPALLAGADRMFGPWFTEAWADPARRRHGVAFATAEEAERFVCSRRLDDAALGALTPPASPQAQRQRSTYPHVALPDPAAAVALLADPARWPDIGCAAGRFTALRPGGLEGQTFEIEVALEAVPRAPVFTRGYVTATAVWASGDPVLERSVAALAEVAGTAVVPDGGRPLLHLELTTHAGHFLGRAISHVVLGELADGSGWVRDVGEWDPLPLPQAAAYRTGGAVAQHAFWGPGDPELSMLEQLARVA